MLGLGQKVPAKYPFGPKGAGLWGQKICTYMYVHAYTRAPKKGQKRVLGITLARQNVFTQHVYSFPRFFGVPDRSRTVSGPNGTIWTPVQGGVGAVTPADPQKPPNWKKVLPKWP